jgi:hypothetical protein
VQFCSHSCCLLKKRLEDLMKLNTLKGGQGASISQQWRALMI